MGLIPWKIKIKLRFWKLFGSIPHNGIVAVCKQIFVKP